MAYDLSGFVSKPQKFEGLSNLADNLRTNTALEQKSKQDAEGKKSASTKLFTNYLDDKAKFTGTKYDPYTHELTANALTQAMDLIKQGANDSDIMTAIAPLVNKANQYSLNAQGYAAKKKEALDRVKGVKGIDLQKLSDEMDKQAFEGKDISTVDPSLDYADMALKNGDVYTAEGFDEAYTKAKMNTNVGTVKHTDKKGKMSKNKVKLVGQDYLISETDADGNHTGFVPKYQIATDGGDPLMHKFQTDQGMADAPVRLLDKDLFDRLTPSEKAYTLQEARKYAKANGVELSSKQAENFARAIAYDEKKSRQSGTFETVEETKAAPQIKVTVNSGGTVGEKKQAVTDSDTHKALDETEADANGNLDVTPFLGGVTFLTNSKGKRRSQPNVTFNPSNQMFTYEIPDPDYTGDDYDAAPIIKKQASLAKLKTMAKTNNSPADLSFLQGFGTYKRGKEDKKPEQQQAEEKPTGFLGGLFNTAKKYLAPSKKANTEPSKQMTAAEKMKAALQTK